MKVGINTDKGIYMNQDLNDGDDKELGSKMRGLYSKNDGKIHTYA